MKTKRSHISAAAAALLFVASCGSQTDKGSGNASQSVTVTPEALQEGICDTLRFGRMRRGETAVKSLRAVNGGKAPMVLLRHVTSCGCIALEYDRRPTAPEASTEIRCEFDSHGQQGWQMKLVEFYFADSARPLKLYVEAEVE